MMEVHSYTLPGLWVFAASLKRTITIAQSGAEERVIFLFGNIRLGTFVWEPWRGHFRLGSSLWELRFRTATCGFRRGNFVWELSFGDRRLGPFVCESSVGLSVNGLHLGNCIGHPRVPRKISTTMGIVDGDNNQVGRGSALTNSPRSCSYQLITCSDTLLPTPPAPLGK